MPMGGTVCPRFYITDGIVRDVMFSLCDPQPLLTVKPT